MDKRLSLNVYEPFARPLYDLPDCEPVPEATGASQAPDDDVGPERTVVTSSYAALASEALYEARKPSRQLG
jgi:hypothetical protein